VFVKDEPKVPSTVDCVEQGIVYGILASCFLSPVRRNSILEELRVRRFAIMSLRKRSVEQHFEGE